MRLPADRSQLFEALTRALAFALLVVLVLQLFSTPLTRDGHDAVRLLGTSGLVEITTQPKPARVLHFDLLRTPPPVERAWMAALGTSGSQVRWSGQLTPLSISTRPAASPDGGHIALVSAPPSSTVTLRDDVSVIDSTRITSGLAAFPFALAAGRVIAVAGSDSAWDEARDSVILRRLLVLGKAGWETKFVIAALEEGGWKVDAVMTVAPSVDVRQGSPTLLDTARYSAVIALDESAASRARDINSFLRSGGGVVLGEAAARDRAFSSIRATSETDPAPRPVSNSDTVTRSSSQFTSLRLLKDAIPLEMKERDIAVGARRIDFGRLVQIAYPETWRWRMQGSASAIADHRSWWSGIVSQVAYAPRRSSENAASNRAPFADLVGIAGNSVSPPPQTTPFSSSSNPMLWMVALFALLMVEWTSRRLRGAR